VVAAQPNYKNGPFPADDCENPPGEIVWKAENRGVCLPPTIAATAVVHKGR
jgi:hypothetical protein